jgi:hypothetical protein
VSPCQSNTTYQVLPRFPPQELPQNRLEQARKVCEYGPLEPEESSAGPFVSLSWGYSSQKTPVQSSLRELLGTGGIGDADADQL